MPGTQAGEDPTFPADQYYNPPEETPVKVTVLSEQRSKREELREYRYTKVKVTIAPDTPVSGDEVLDLVRTNPGSLPDRLKATIAANTPDDQ